MYHFVKNNTELAISRDSISICGFGGPGFENWNASNCRKPCLPVPRNIFNFLIKKTGSKETNLNFLFKFYLQHVVFKCKYCWCLRSQIQFPILGKRGKQGYQVDHLGGGQLSTKWSAAHKKETFDLWNWWLDYITGKWLGEGMSSLQKIIFYLNLPLSCISSPKFISMFWGIFAVAWRQIQLCPSSLQVFWVEAGDRSSP